MEVGTRPTLRSRHLGGPASHLSFNPRPQAGGRNSLFVNEPSHSSSFRRTPESSCIRSDASSWTPTFVGVTKRNERKADFPSPLGGEGGEMRLRIEPDEGYPLTLPSPTRGEG